MVEKEGTYGWNVFFVNDRSRGKNRVPMDGMCCLQTMNRRVKRILKGANGSLKILKGGIRSRQSRGQSKKE